MSDLVKTAGGSTITYTVISATDTMGTYVSLSVVASDGIYMAIKYDVGSYDKTSTVLANVLSQLNTNIADPAYTSTEIADATSARTYLNANGTSDFASLVNQVQAESSAVDNTVSDLNKQLQAIHARLDRVDDDLISHYAGISQLVMSLAANPFTAPSAALSLPIYNMSSVGQTLLKKLLHLIPGYDTFKQLQHLDSAALLDGIADKLETQVANIADTAVQNIENVVSDQVNAIANKAAAITDNANALAAKVTATNAYNTAVTNASNASSALQTAIANGSSQSTINSLTSTKISADAALASATTALSTATTNATTASSALTSIQNIISSSSNTIANANKTNKSINSFIGSLTGIAKGRTKTAIFKP